MQPSTAPTAPAAPSSPQRHRGVPLDVRRFGWGYWIGATASTLIYIGFTLPDPDSGSLDWCTILLRLIALPMMGAGIVASFASFIRGVSERDAWRVIGSVLGFGFSTWPIAWACLMFS